MAYIKQNFIDGEVLEAVHLNNIEDQIVVNEYSIESKADLEHTHTKSEITDFPASMPASDVSDWAKEATKPTYTCEEIGAAEEMHTHIVDDISGMNKMIQSIRMKILALSGGMRNVLKSLEKEQNKVSCSVSSVRDESGNDVDISTPDDIAYVNIKCGSESLYHWLRLRLADNQVNTYEVSMLSGWGFIRTSVYSTSGATKTLKGVFIDDTYYASPTNTKLKQLLALDTSFKQLTLNYVVTEDNDTKFNVTLTINADGISITESTTDGTLVKDLISGTYVKSKLTHGTSAKVFTMGDTAGLPYFERLATYSNVVVKRILVKGGF